MLTAGFALTDNRARDAASAAVAAGYHVVLIGRGDVDTTFIDRGIDVRLCRLSLNSPPARPTILGVLSDPLAFRTTDQQARLAESRRVARQTARLTDLKERRSRAKGPVRLLLDARVRARLVWSVLGRETFRVRAEASRRRDTRSEGVVDRVLATAAHRLAPRTMWRRFAPEYLETATALEPMIEDAAPDIVHAVGPHAIGVAVQSARKANARGRRVSVIFDAVDETFGCRRHTARLAADRHVDEYIRDVDAVLAPTAGAVAELRTRYALSSDPILVPPSLATGPTVYAPRDVRAAVNLSGTSRIVIVPHLGAPVLAYEALLEAVAGARDIHVVVLEVAADAAPIAAELRTAARTRGIEPRIHLQRVPRGVSLAAFARTADAACSLGPVGVWDAEPGELYELVAAGLPIVVAGDSRAASALRRLGLDAVDMSSGVADAIDIALSGRVSTADEELRERLVRERSRDSVSALLQGVWGDGGRTPGPRPMPADPPDPPRVLIGRSNSAGQAAAWARSIRRFRPDIRAFSLAVNAESGLAFPSDVSISPETFGSPAWQVDALEAAIGHVSHVMVESLHAVFPGFVRGVKHNIQLLERGGFDVALVFHGSDIRDPELHARLHPNSPFPLMRAEEPEHVDQLTAGARLRREVAQWFNGPVFVSTPDLLDYVDGATWLPVVVDADGLRSERPVLERARPVVLHAPTSTALKGSEVIDRVLSDLHRQEVIDYRRVQGIPAADMHGVIASADIVVDQLNMGLYGVLAAEAMAAGRLVMSEVGNRIRRRVPDEVPIVEVDSRTLRAQLLTVLDERETSRETAAAGPSYVEKYHNGRRAAEIIAAWVSGHELTKRTE